MGTSSCAGWGHFQKGWITPCLPGRRQRWVFRSRGGCSGNREPCSFLLNASWAVKWLASWFFFLTHHLPFWEPLWPSECVPGPWNVASAQILPLSRQEAPQTSIPVDTLSPVGDIGIAEEARGTRLPSYFLPYPAFDMHSWLTTQVMTVRLSAACRPFRILPCSPVVSELLHTGGQWLVTSLAGSLQPSASPCFTTLSDSSAYKKLGMLLVSGKYITSDKLLFRKSRNKNILFLLPICQAIEIHYSVGALKIVWP